MSMKLLADLTNHEMYVIAGCLVIGSVVAWWVGALRKRSVAGASRAQFDPDFATALWGIGFIGLGAWMLVPSLYVTLTHRAASPTTIPTPITATSTTLPATTPSTSNEDSASNASSSSLPPGVLVMLGASAQVAGLIALLLGDLAMLGRRANRLGSGGSGFPRGLLLGLLGACAAVPLTFVASAIANSISTRIGHPIEPHALLRIFEEQRHTIVPLLVVISAVFVAPMFEEFLFRGHLQTALLVSIRMLDVRPPVVEATWPRWTAILIAAVIFAAIHGSAWMFFPLMVLAICNGYAYERTGNLWVPITMHATFNAVSLSIAYLTR